MIDGYADRDAASLIERGWFSSIAAVRTAQAECEVLRKVMELAESAWRRARTQLAELEYLRDALGDQLADIDEQYPEPVSNPRQRSVMSVAGSKTLSFGTELAATTTAATPKPSSGGGAIDRKLLTTAAALAGARVRRAKDALVSPAGL
jgi:hypothetical protein